MSNPIPPYVVTTPYGKPGKWAAGYHTGDDYSTKGKTGVPIHASKGGWVVDANWGSSYGVHVVLLNKKTGIQHGYCHLSSKRVTVGKHIKKGEIIGLSGNTGNSTGPHLHYEERKSPFNYWAHRKPIFNREK